MEKLKAELEDQFLVPPTDLDTLIYSLVAQNETEHIPWSQSILSMMEQSRDPRVDGWMLMDSLWHTVVLCGLYLLLVLYIGPAYMNNRKPYDLKHVMLAYNLFQTIFNVWVFAAGVHVWMGENFSFMCQPVDYSTTPEAMFALRMAWWFFFSKFIDFIDTFIFVLRKKKSQLTALHIIHHSTMPIFSWFGPKFAGGGHTSFGATVNMLVHVVMYFYYFLAATGVRKEFLTWKKYLTTFQIIQFVAVLIHASLPLLLSDCQYPKEMCYILLFNGALYLVLFSNFYQAAYTKPKLKNQ